MGLGFGLQHIFNDFISFIILLLNGSLKVDDIGEVNGRIYVAEEIRFRTTTVIGLDENYVILPNSELTRNNVVNWTYNKKSIAFYRVDYSTNVSEMMELLKEVAKSTSRVLETPEPFVRFSDYGESSLTFRVYFYTHEIFRADHIKSLMRVEIYKELSARNIKIPFPQRVVHFKKDEEGGHKPTISSGENRFSVHKFELFPALQTINLTKLIGYWMLIDNFTINLNCRLMDYTHYGEVTKKIAVSFALYHH